LVLNTGFVQRVFWLLMRGAHKALVLVRTDTDPLPAMDLAAGHRNLGGCHRGT